MNDILDEKKRLRREFKARGAALTADYRLEADRAIREALLGSEAWRKAKSVFLYVSVGVEPDTRELLEAALKEGRRIYVPLCCPDRTMAAVRIESTAELSPGTLGIPEPPEENERAAPGDLDLAVVPCVTATREGARLGHGAGYYDRFLRLHACPSVCLCYGRMLADGLPTDKHDVRMDCIITEDGHSKTGYR